MLFVYPNLIHEAKVSGSFWASAGNHRCGTSGFRGFILCIFGVRRRFEQKIYRKQRFPKLQRVGPWQFNQFWDNGRWQRWQLFLRSFFLSQCDRPSWVLWGSQRGAAHFWWIKHGWFLVVGIHAYAFLIIYLCIYIYTHTSLSLYMYTYTIDLYTHICIWFCIFMRIHI